MMATAYQLHFAVMVKEIVMTIQMSTSVLLLLIVVQKVNLNAEVALVDLVVPVAVVF